MGLIANLVQGWRGKRAVEVIARHPVLGTALSYVRDTLNDTTQGIGKHWSDKGKQKLLAQVVGDVEKCLNQPNPVQVVRMRTIEFMLLAAQFDVLIMQTPTKHKWLSGELKQYIPELAKSDATLREFFGEQEEPPTDFNSMWDLVLMRYWVLNLHMSAFNQARFALDDGSKDPTKDWFRPCYYSLCIWQENTYRTELGMPLSIDGAQADLKSTMLSTWIQRADEGHKLLRHEWENSWEDTFKEPSPFAGVTFADVK